MNRTEVIAGSAIAVLAAIGIGQLYLDKGALKEQPERKEFAAAPRQESVPSEIKPITADEVVASFMTSLEQGSDEQKIVALTGLLDELDSPTYAKARLSTETAEPLAKAVIAAVDLSSASQAQETLALRQRAAGFVAGRTRGQDAREFALKALEEGPDQMRAQIARFAGFSGGVRGKDIFAKVQELGEKGQIPGDVLPGALRRLGGKKAVEPIVAALKASDQWKTIDACAVELQEYRDPALLAVALERLDQTGLIDKKEKLPWINVSLFGKFMETAEGTPLTRGLRAAKTRPSLVKVSLEAVKRGLEKGEPETRRVAAEAVRKAVIAKIIDAKEGENLLAGRLDHETEPVLKAELTGGLEQVRGMMPKAPQGQQ